MANYDIISEEPTSNSEVLEIISKLDKENLTYREEKIRDFIKKSKPFKLKDFKLAFDEILALDISKLDEEHIIKLIDLKPNNGTELRSIVGNSGIVIVDDTATLILDILKKYNK